MGSVVTSWGICFDFQFKYTGPGFNCTGSFEEGEAVTWSLGTITRGRISSFGVVLGRVETAVGVIIVSFLKDASPDNMGNNEFSVSTLSFREGTSLTKFPTVEDVREAFLFYHMNITSRAITHMPMDTKKAKISMGDSENG